MIGRRMWHSQTYRWVYLPLALGALLSLLLVGNSFRDYRFVSRLLATQGVRHQMRQDVGTLEGQMRRSGRSGESRLKLLREAIEASGGRALWISFHTPEGAVLEQEGDSSFAALTHDEEVTGLRTHEPMFKVVTRHTTEGVVEVFPLRGGGPPPPREAGALPGEQPEGRDRGPRSMVLLELAMPLTPADPSLLKMQRWNLLVGSLGALALLSTVLVSGFSVRSYVKGRLLEQQGYIAREVQTRLLPGANEEFGGVRTAMEYRPAEQVSGDFYDVFRAGENKVGIVIGDVSGQGMPAAILMGVIHGAVRSSAWTATKEDHERETARLNQLLCEYAEDHRYATMFWGYFDRSAGRLQYVNAGHASPLMVRRRGGAVAINALEARGPVIGLLADAGYEQAGAEVLDGDLLVMCSDGLLEATRADGEEYGEERLRAALMSGYGSTPDKVRTAVLRSVTEFLAGAIPHDDLTLVVMQFG